jgi:hypothetical protein
MPHGCDYSVRVEINVEERPSATGKHPRTGLRKFIVEYDADGQVLRIKEIKPLPAPSIGIYHQPYWKGGTHPLGVLPRQIIAAAAAKKAAEDRAHDATP